MVVFFKRARKVKKEPLLVFDSKPSGPWLGDKKTRQREYGKRRRKQQFSKGRRKR